MVDGGDPLRDEGNGGREGITPLGTLWPAGIDAMLGDDATEPMEPARLWLEVCEIKSWWMSADFVEMMLPLDSGSRRGLFCSVGWPCFALNSARYCM